MQSGSAGGLGNLVGLLSLLSGGAVSNFSVLSMGVYPYVTAQLILQLLIPIIPRLEEMQKEGEQGRRKINRLTYFATVPMAMLNAIGQVAIFEQIAVGATGGTARVLPNWGLVPAENILPDAGHHHHHDRGHHVRHLVGRVDHRAGHRPGLVDHHLRRHCVSPAVQPVEHRQHVAGRPHRNR